MAEMSIAPHVARKAVAAFCMMVGGFTLRGALPAATPPAPEEVLRHQLEAIQSATTVEYQYTIRQPNIRGYQTVHEYRELAATHRVRTEIATYSVGSAVPKLLTVQITNDRGFFLIRPASRVVIKDPVKSARPARRDNPDIHDGFWHFQGYTYSATTKSCAATTAPGSDEPAWEIVQAIQLHPAAERGTDPAFLRYVITQQDGRLIGFGAYDKAGAQLKQLTFDTFVVNGRFEDALFETPAGYEYLFPQTPEEFARRLNDLALRLASKRTQKTNMP